MKKTLRFAIGCTLVASTALFAATTPSSFSPQQVTDIQHIVHDYLVSNPQVLVEASRTLQAQQEQKMEAQAMTAVGQNKAAIFNDTQAPSIGPKTAPTTLVEFFDYQCGHCREMQPVIEKVVAADPQLRVVFKELPIFGGTSAYAAKAALAVSMMEPAKYYAFHNAMLTSTTPLSPTTIDAIAKKQGIDVAKMTKMMDSKAIDAQLKSNFQLAQALKVMGTPTFVIGNKAETKFRFIPGATSMDDLQKQLNAVK